MPMGRYMFYPGYHPKPERPSIASIGNRVFDAYSKARQLRLAEEEQARKEKRDAEIHSRALEQLALQKVGQERLNRKYELEAGEADRKRYSEGEEAINERLLAGDPEGAARVAKAFGFSEFRRQRADEIPTRAEPTPRLQSIFQRGEELAALGIADRPPTEEEFRFTGQPQPEVYGDKEEFGPLLPEEQKEVDRRSQIRRSMADPEYQAAAKDYLDVRQRAKETRENPPWVAQGTYGQVKFDPASRERATEKQHTEAADRIKQVAGKLESVDPHSAQELKIVEAQVRQRLLKPDEAMKQLNFYLGQRNKLQAAETRAQNSYRRPDYGDDNLQQRRLDFARNNWNDLMRQFEVPDKLDEYYELRENRGKLLSGNAIEIRQVYNLLARAMAGPGVMSNQDYNKTVERVGGALTAAGSSLNKFLSGNPSDKELQIVAKAVASQIPMIDQRIARAEQMSSQRIQGQAFSDPVVQDYLQNLHRSTFGYGGRRTQPLDPLRAAGGAAGEGRRQRNAVEALP